MFSCRRWLILGGGLTIGLLIAPGLALAQPGPNAQPTGGSVTAGSGSIADSPGVTTIDQSSERLAINWQSFNVGSQQTVDVFQPNSSAVALMRVTSANPSQLVGRIRSNGQVILVNQAGVRFDAGAQANTAGLALSAAGVANRNFMAGRMVFDQPAAPNAAISNAGKLTVAQAGLLVMLAPAVRNSGVIDAKLGHVEMLGAKAATLAPGSDGLAVSNVGSVTTVPLTASGKPVAALVTQAGTIRAPGGTIQIAADAPTGVIQRLESVSGMLNADTAGGRTGTVKIGGAGGAALIAGHLQARGTAPDAVGGAIMADPSEGVALSSAARANASGRAGGGVIALGTTLARARGGPGTAASNVSRTVSVPGGAVLQANATRNGNGGDIVLLSTNQTSFDGTASVDGGPQGGNGGRIEISSADALAIGGTLSASAPLGTTGTVLLDPRRLILLR